MKKIKDIPILQIIPLGGLGEIGHNMILLRTPQQSLMIDAGLLFPHSDDFGIDYLIPDITSTIQAYGEDLESLALTDLIITHGHEDHIGAIVHVLKLFPNITIWANPLAMALVQYKLKNHLKFSSDQLKIYHENTVLSFHDFDIHPVHVNHSIPHTFGLLILNKKKDFSLFYVSDFKYDDKSPYELPMNLEKIQHLSQNSKVKLLMIDSTNIMSQKKTPSEADLLPALQEIFEQAPGRIFLTFFASNIHRLQSIINVSYKLGKKIVYLGASQKFYATQAVSLGLLNFYQETLMPEEDISSLEEYQERNLVILLSGCQGDLRGALRRVVSREHPLFKLRANDYVLFSSKTIPGNEIQVASIWNKIVSQGAKLISADDALIHASGHPGEVDLKIVVNSFSPTHIIPIHGEHFMLHKHINFIRNHFPLSMALLLNNSWSLKISTLLKLEVSIPSDTHVAPPPILIHGKGIPLERKALNMRRKMAERGVIFLSVFGQAGNEKLAFVFAGLPAFLDEEKFKSDFNSFLKNTIRRHFQNLSSMKREEILKEQSRKFLFPLLGYKPQIFLHILNSH